MGSSSRELKSLIRKWCDQDHSDKCHKEQSFYHISITANRMITATATNCTNALSSLCALSDIILSPRIQKQEYIKHN
jgi:hypothetical protein